jgi:DNA helicase IV
LSSSAVPASPEQDLVAEQATVAMLYGRLDQLREQARQRLAEVLRTSGGTHQARSEREATVGMYAEQLQQWDAVEHGLCFGRLDFDSGELLHIGRIGLFDDSDDFEPLLVDWRAPAARAFYLATAASPQGVRRRRHIRTRLRDVVGLDDEVLDIASATHQRSDGLTSEAALLNALNAGRTGRMRDIVETIQVEQDHVIRAGLGGMLVVQGGPGTGKTAVALHRAAYLLYTYRQQLSKQGVLILGPNQTFLRYIEQVLPSLAETGVLLCTLGDLYPTVTARQAESPRAAALKGELVMLDVLAAAVADRQQAPDDVLRIELTDIHAGLAYQREVVELDRATVQAARDRARRSGRPHNLARTIFVEEIISALGGQLADRLGFDPYADDPLGGGDAPGGLLFDEGDIAEIRRDLRKDTEVAAALERLWPTLTPQRLLSELYASDERLAVAAPKLSDEQRQLLRRDPGADPSLAWTPADVPLLDEAAELLGEDEEAARQAAERERQAQIGFAEGVLAVAAGSRSSDVEEGEEAEFLGVGDLLDAARLAERQEHHEQLTAAQRAAADRSWTFGHIIVDEAQELSPMAWRLLMRRCPSRSMTVVGDVAQTSELAGASGWHEMFAPYVADRWRLTELTISYRTPAEIMAVAAKVLAVIDPTLSPPRSVRETGTEPQILSVSADGLMARLADVVRVELARLDDGRLGVITPAGLVDQAYAAVAQVAPQAATGDRANLESTVVVLPVRQAKGLEFDTVIVVEPQEIVAESARGNSDLYVALTRATQRLSVIHTGEWTGS